MKKKLRGYFETGWPASFWSVIVFLLLAMPSRQLPAEKIFVIPQFDKLVHAAVFAVFVFLWALYAQKRVNIKHFRKVLWLIAIIATAYGVLMEYVQLWIGRDFDFWDMVADAAGACFAAYFYAKK